ncbi:MAG: TolC family protein, partial [Acidobacteriota bacterium]
MALVLAACLAGPTVAAEIDERPTVEMSLQDALALAMDRNLDIAVQQYEVDITEASVDVQRALLDSEFSTTYFENEINNANANPFVGFPVVTQKNRQINASWNDPTVWGGNFNLSWFADKAKANFLQLRPQYSTEFNVVYTQSLTRNLGAKVNRAPIRIAQNNLRISRSSFESTVMNTVEAAEFAYWDLVFARLDLEVQRSSLRLAEELLRMNKAKVEVGTMAPIDVTQAEAGVADRVEGVIVAEAAVLAAEDALRQLINPAPDSNIWRSAIVPVDQPDFRPLMPDPESAIETAMQYRPDLEQQRLTIASNELQEEVDRKAKQWDVSLEGRYGTQGLSGTITECQFASGTGTFTILNPDQAQQCALAGGNAVEILNTRMSDAIQDLRNRDFQDWRVAATLTIPIGNRDRKARYAQSRLRHQQSQVQMQSLLLTAEIDVRNRVRDVTTNIKRVEAAKKNRELQQENVEAEQKKFENGMSTSFTVLQVQDALRSAERRENLAIVDYNKSLASLEKSKG